MAAGPTFPAFLKIEALDSEGAFRELETGAKTATDRMRKVIEADGPAIQRALQKMLSVPEAGKLDLDTSAFEAAAQRAQAYANGLRLVANAAEAQALATGDTTKATAQYIALTSTAAREAEQAARAATDEAAAMARLRGDLAALPPAHRAAIDAAEAQARALNAVMGGSRANRAAIQSLGFQVQDFAVQVVSGQSALIAFAQQLPQATGALTQLEGRFAAVGRFLGGPWGIVLVTATAVLGPLVGKMIDFGDATEEATDKLRKDAEDTERNRIAKERFNRTLEGQIALQRELTAELEKANLTQRQQAVAQLNATKRNLDDLRADAQRERTRAAEQSALADRLQREAQQAFARGDDSAGGSAARALEAGKRAREAQDRARAAEAAAQAAERNVRAAELPIYKDRAEAATDAATAATIRYQDALGRLDQARIAGSISAQEYQRRLVAEKRAYDAATEAAQKAERAARKSGVSQPLTTFRDPVFGRTTGTFGERRPGHAHAGIDYAVPVGTAVRTPAAGVVDAAGARGSYGNTIVINFGAGTTGRFAHLSRFNVKPGDVVNAGDVIGYSGGQPGAPGAGRSSGPHLHYEVRRNGKAVDPRTGRFPTDEVKASEVALKAQQKALADAEREAEALTRTYEKMLDRLDPVAAATTEFRRELQNIATLSASTIGTDGTVTPGRISSGDAALLARAADQRRRDAEQQAIDESIPAFIREGAREFDQIVTGASDRVAQNFYDGAQALETAVYGISDLLGVRLPRGLQVLLQPGGITGQAGRTADAVAMALDNLGVTVGDGFKKTAKELLTGASTGQLAGGLVLGRSGNSTTSAIGGVLGEVAGKAAGKAIGEGATGLLKTLGGAAGPLGAIAGGLLGGVVGGLFGKGPKASGTATLTGVDTRALTTGTSGDTRNAASSLATSVQSGLQQIADQLGGSVGAFDTVLGVYDGKYRVRTSATGWNGKGGLNFSGSSAMGLTDFGEDEAAAIRFAILDALQDGAIAGIREGTKRLLQAGQDLDKAVQKALSFEQVFKDLRASEDPVGAAIDTLNAKFTNLRKVFDEAGASAEERAQLERLYGFERAEAIEQATQAMTSALRGLMSDLTTGDNGRSLRDRIAAAREAYDPLAARVAAEEKVDYDKFAEAARTALDLTRQIEGSGTAYFDFLDSVTALTGKALAGQDNLISLATSKDTPFGTPGAAQGTAEPIVSAVDKQTDAIVAALNGQLGAVNDNLGALLQQGRAAAGSSGGFAGFSDRRNF